MDTKPTPTLAKLHISQEKYDYALAIYLYLQEKENKSYSNEISEIIKEICSSQWNEYGKPITQIFTKEDITQLLIIPDDLIKTAKDTLADIHSEFELPSSNTEITDEETLDTIESPETEKEATAKAEEDNSKEKPDFLTMGDKVYEEPENKLPEKKQDSTEQEDLVPGLDEFSSNYKENVTKGLIDEKANNGDEEIDAKLKKDIDQKLINVLRILRSMSTEELHTIITKKIQDGKKLEDLTLSDLEELLD